ncbi:MAG TPA: helix-turn-helix domain-containing protein [Actinophytocola sp.]|nr:helix-turn-helix domain-containing protein [Actinophytocola sp.]
MHLKFGNLLKSHRIRRGLTQRQLADLSTVSVRAIRDLESGRAYRPRPDTVRLIADGLGLSGAVRADLESAARAEPTGPELPARAVSALGPVPAPLGVMLGRDSELVALRGLLASGAQRLVTLTGLSGIGKTRLAMDVAATLRDTDGLAAGWLDAGDPAAGWATTAALDLGGRPALLVLDGLDENRPPAEALLALLHRRRELRVLCTARAPLAVPGEWTVPLAPLAVPAPRTEADPDALSRVASVALLAHHAGQVQPGFRLTAANSAAVAAVVRRLAGIPVLLEAAANWFRVYRPAELLSYLRSDPLGFATDRLADWHAAVRRAVAGLHAAELTVLSGLTERAAARSVAELARLTGLPAAGCAAALGRLVLLGLVTVAHTGPVGRFRALEPVRAVRFGRPTAVTGAGAQAAPEPAETAAVLPLRLPVPAVRAG